MLTSRVWREDYQQLVTAPDASDLRCPSGCGRADGAGAGRSCEEVAKTVHERSDEPIAPVFCHTAREPGAMLAGDTHLERSNAKQYGASLLSGLSDFVAIAMRPPSRRPRASRIEGLAAAWLGSKLIDKIAVRLP